MVKFNQEIGDKLTVGLDVVFSRVTNRQQTSRGTITSTASPTGTQANPFCVNPPGVLPGPTAGDMGDHPLQLRRFARPGRL